MKNVQAQDDEEFCGTPEDPGFRIDLNQRGGLYITAEGELRVLVVFVSFPDDNNEHPYWSVGEPPSVMGEFIDANIAQQSTNHANLTHYYRVMSMGLYDMIGEAIYVEAPNPATYYGYDDSDPNNIIYANRSAANHDVLEDVVNPLLDFSDYDNWTRNAYYDHSNQPDGVVDMVFMVWRGFYFRYLGEASLGGGSALNADGVQIKFGRPSGSGVTCQYPYNYGPRDVLKISIHEFAHWLIGPHPYYTLNKTHRIWGMLGDRFADGDCANAFERHQLAWINAIDVTEVNAPLADYVTTGVAYRYHPPNGVADEYYYFENHQKIHTTSDSKTYDDATKNPDDKGIFVLHAQGPYNDSNNIRCKISDGQYDWENPFWVQSCWGPEDIPAYRPLNENPDGENRCDKLLHTQGSRDWLHILTDENDFWTCASFYRGTQSIFSFNQNTTTVISPWSNPNTNIWGDPDPVDITFAMEVLNQSVDVINVHFFVTNPEDAKPSRPQNFQAVNLNGHPRMTWDSNLEPDLSGYRLYKYLETWSSGADTFVISIHEDSMGYTDEWFDTGGRKPWDKVTYWMSALDDQGKESDETEDFSFTGSSGVQWKQAVETASAIPQAYYLSVNFPNPFNPTTSIRYDLPEPSYVSVVIYDILGREVRTLLDSREDAGFKSVVWDSKDNSGNIVAAGIYIYTLRAWSQESEKIFHKTHKMIFLK